MKRPALIVWDECHHVAAGSWARIHRNFPGAFHVGLTATPLRLDGKGLGRWFSRMVNGPSIDWLTEHGYLAPYRLFAPSTVNLQGVHTRMGDFVRSEIDTLFDKPTITGDAIREYQAKAPGKRAVVFCVSVKHSKHVVAQFQATGINAYHVDGETPHFERDRAVALFQKGDIQVLSNVDLFGEGFDLPALEVSILLRPTQSLALYLQQCGRALRPSPGKEYALILDHAGNCQRHGLPDEERDWSLKGRERARDDAGTGPSVKICPKCLAAQHPGRPACTYCGHVFEVQDRQVEEVEGDLVEVDKVKLRRRKQQEQGVAETMDDLVKLGTQRGYKRPRLWAKHVFNARQAKKLRMEGPRGQ